MSEASEKIKATGQLLGWLVSRMFFTLVVDLALLGGYHAHEYWQSTQPTVIDLAKLPDEVKAELATALLEEGYTGAKEKPRKG